MKCWRGKYWIGW